MACASGVARAARGRPAVTPQIRRRTPAGDDRASASRCTRCCAAPTPRGASACQPAVHRPGAAAARRHPRRRQRRRGTAAAGIAVAAGSWWSGLRCRWRTSTALVVGALRAWGFASVDFLVRNRFEFGYGLTPKSWRGRRTQPDAAGHRRQRHFESRRRRQRARPGAGRAGDRSPPAGGRTAAGQRDREPQRRWRQLRQPLLAGVGVAFYVLAALKRALDAAGMCRRVRPAWPSSSTWWHWGPWPTWCAGRQQSRAGGAGPAADPQRSLRAGHHGAAGSGAAPARGPDGDGLGFAVAPRLNARAGWTT